MKRIAVDFDGILRRNFNKGQNIFQKIVMAYLKRKQKQGVVIILNTLRTDEDRIGDAISWLAEKDFYPDFVNENDPDSLISFLKDSRKIDADVYIDDRNVGLIGWLLRSF